VTAEGERRAALLVGAAAGTAGTYAGLALGRNWVGIACLVALAALFGVVRVIERVILASTCR